MKVTLIAATSWCDSPGVPEWNPTDHNPERIVDDTELLIEFAGRNCYQSWNNPAGKSNQEYIRTILEHGHGSVLEHANATFFITGISRSCTHEMIRHRAGFAYSELSQRYVNVEDAEFVIPPALQDDAASVNGLALLRECFVSDYRELVRRLEAKGLTRKQAREAARCVMPNGIETKIVVTGNFRSWRHFIEMRGSEHADAEIRQVAVAVARVLCERFPAVFGDCQFPTYEDGSVGVTTKYKKV